MKLAHMACLTNVISHTSLEISPIWSQEVTSASVFRAQMALALYGHSIASNILNFFYIMASGLGSSELFYVPVF